MSEGSSTAEVRLELHEEGSPPEELEELTARLRRRLLELDVDAVEPLPGGEAPPGTRGVGTTLGSLIVRFGTPQLVLAVVAEIRSWLSGHGSRTVRIAMDGDTLELTGVSSQEQDELIAAWIAHHSAPK